MRERQGKRQAVFATDRSLPVVAVTSQIPRELYDRFTKLVHRRDTNRSAMVRQLIERWVLDQEAPRALT